MIKVIADAGINHNGDIEIAKRLVEAAKESGADVVKFQTFWNINYLSKYELTKDEFLELRAYCEQLNIEFMSTPHDFEAIHFLDDIVEVHKVASCYMAVPNFLKEIGNKNKPLIMSTGSFITSDGMLPIDSISKALSFIPHKNITLLHCVAKYPCSDSKTDRIKELEFLGYPVGLSDHTLATHLPKVPVIEKHFMLDDVDSIDSSVSLTPKLFKEMVNNLKN